MPHTSTFPELLARFKTTLRRVAFLLILTVKSPLRDIIVRCLSVKHIAADSRLLFFSNTSFHRIVATLLYAINTQYISNVSCQKNLFVSLSPNCFAQKGARLWNLESILLYITLIHNIFK